MQGGSKLDKEKGINNVINMEEFRRKKKIEEKREQEKIGRAKALRLLLNNFKFNKENKKLLQNMCGGDLEFCLLIDLLYGEEAATNLEVENSIIDCWYTINIDNLLFFNNIVADEFGSKVRKQILELAFRKLRDLNLINYRLNGEKIDYCMEIDNILHGIYLEYSRETAVRIAAAWWKQKMKIEKEIDGPKNNLYFKKNIIDLKIREFTKEKIDEFEKNLSEILKKEFRFRESSIDGERKKDYIKLSTEYLPDKLIRLAIEKSGIPRESYPKHRELIITPEAVIAYRTLISSDLNWLDKSKVKFIYFTRKFIEEGIDKYKYLDFEDKVSEERWLELFEDGKDWLDENNKNFYIDSNFEYIDTSFLAECYEE